MNKNKCFGDISLKTENFKNLIFNISQNIMENQYKLVITNWYKHKIQVTDLLKQLSCLSESSRKGKKHGLKVRAKFQKNTNISKGSSFHDLKFYTSFMIRKIHFSVYKLTFQLKN